MCIYTIRFFWNKLSWIPLLFINTNISVIKKNINKSLLCAPVHFDAFLFSFRLLGDVVMHFPLFQEEITLSTTPLRFSLRNYEDSSESEFKLWRFSSFDWTGITYGNTAYLPGEVYKRILWNVAFLKTSGVFFLQAKWRWCTQRCPYTQMSLNTFRST